MDREEARIRQEIEQTRASMLAKIDLIQEHLGETVEDTGSTAVNVMNTVLEQVKRVQEMIETVTSTVESAVQQVQHTASKAMAGEAPGSTLIAEIYQRPWAMMGTAVFVGYILGLNRSSAAGAASELTTDRFMTYNPMGNPLLSPTSEAVKPKSPPAPAQATDPMSPPSHRP